MTLAIAVHAFDFKVRLNFLVFPPTPNITWSTSVPDEQPVKFRSEFR
jgi:hypothetical protein